MYADSAYQSEARKKRIKEKSIRNRVLERAYCNKPLADTQNNLTE